MSQSLLVVVASKISWTMSHNQESRLTTQTQTSHLDDDDDDECMMMRMMMIRVRRGGGGGGI